MNIRTLFSSGIFRLTSLAVCILLLASCSFGYASAMKENLAGIEDYTRIATHLQPEQIVKYGALKAVQRYESFLNLQTF